MLKTFNFEKLPIVEIVNEIIIDATKNRASDIHIDPFNDVLKIRIRIDGTLIDYATVPNDYKKNLVTRIKIIAGMNITENRLPQDGAIKTSLNGIPLDMRVSSLPTNNGEKIVIRILDYSMSIQGLEKLGFTKDNFEKIMKMINLPNGIILVTGATGTGKSTTVYSILQRLNSEEANVITVEDPVEMDIPGVNQVQVNSEIGLTFANVLRSILRQDPDIILVGEIRDYETLEIAISAALTGHLVLSTVHTNSAAATVTRLIEMGAKDYLVSSTLSGVIAQRLVRRLCDDCKEEFFATHDEARQIIANEDEIKEFMKKPIYRAKGCNKCDFTGYKGRLGVYEIMAINKEIKKLVALGAHDLEIEEAAVKNGMKTLHQSCLNHILNGMTTIDEFVRVLGVVNE